MPALHSSDAGSFVLHASDGEKTAEQVVLVTVASTIGKVNLTLKDAGKTRSVASGMALRMKASAVDATGGDPDHLGLRRRPAEGPGNGVAHRFRKPGTFTVKAKAESETAQMKVVVRRRAVEVVGAPDVVDGVMTGDACARARQASSCCARTAARGRSTVPAASTERTLRIQVTTGPLVRLTLRLTPSKKSPLLRVFSVRRLVLVSPLSAG